jgi:MFS family permease
MPESVGPSVRGDRYRWWVLGILTATQTCQFLDRTIIGVVLPPLKQEFKLSDAQGGLLAGLAFGLAFAACALPFGYLADRVNRKRLLVAVITVWSAMTALCAAATGYVSLLLFRMGVGAAESGANPTILSLVADYFGRKQRSVAVGILYTSATFGNAFAFIIGGYVAQHAGWRWAFLLAGVPGIILAVLLLATLREPKRGAQDNPGAADQAPSLKETVAAIGAQRSILHLITGMTLTAVVVSATSAWLISFLMRQHHVPLGVSGLISGLGLGIFGGLGAFIAGIVADKLSQTPRGHEPSRAALVAAVTTSLAGVCGIVAVTASALVIAIGFMFLYSLFNTAYNGPAYGLMLTATQPRMRGRVVAGFQFLANLIGYGLGPYIVGLLSDRIGGPSSLRWALSIVFLVNLWAACHFFMAARRGRREIGVMPATPA